MAIVSSYEPGVVVNVVGQDDSLDDVLLYISQHNSEWVNSAVIWDMDHFAFDSTTASQVRTFVSDTAEFLKRRMGMKTAVAVASDLGFGMMRMLQMISEPLFANQMQVFRHRAEAIAWLAIEPDQLGSDSDTIERNWLRRPVRVRAPIRQPLQVPYQE